ncbi:MAG: inositol monophosphatase [Zetaproteobacteria bacterium]|nr:MAG: inositol monophosphatase [Zetaproteobacteria bacterium]
MHQRNPLDDIPALLTLAGRDIIMPAFVAGTGSRQKTDGSIVTETDLACQAFLKEKLKEFDASIGFLGEEMTEETQIEQLHGQKRFWCLDPLDGTTNFETGFPAFAISLALIENSMPVWACIHDPVRQETFTAKSGQGATLNGAPIRAAPRRHLSKAVGCIDFKRLSPPLGRRLLKRGLYRSQRNIGTCALEWAWLASGRVHFIIHGGEKLWDYAAGSLIAQEAGCVFSDFARGELFPITSLSSSILGACHDQLHAHLIQEVQSAIS